LTPDGSLDPSPVPPRGFAARVFGLVVAALLAWGLFRIFEPFLGPILWALLLAFLLYPLNVRLRGRFRGRRGAAALLLTVAVTLGIVVPVALLLVAFVGQGAELVRRAGEITTRYRIVRPSDILRLPFLERALTWIEQRIPVTTEQVQGWLATGAERALQFILANSGTFFLGALGAVVGIALMLFILYFFFRDGEEMAARGLRILPMPPERKRRLVDHLSSVVKAVVFGSLLTALCQGALVGIAFWIAGLPSPVVFGVIAAVTSLLPVVGTALVWAPGAIYLAASGRWGWALFLAGWGALVVGTADNFLRPLFISGRAEISTLPVFFGVLGGIGAFGPIGLFLGPVVIALALALLRFAEETPAGEAGSPEQPA
jgi:predicted PurR-regulated permease PerM